MSLDPLSISSAPDPEIWELKQTAAVGFCERPIILAGYEPGSSSPSRTIAVRCRSRRASDCVPCARAFQLDCRRLLRLGFVPERRVLPDVRWWWLTLTAPGIELTGAPVHAARLRVSARGREYHLPCRPSACRICGGRPSCLHRHRAGDGRAGSPVEGHEDCFRYWALVRWNALTPELWNQTVQHLRNELRTRGRHVGIPWTLQFAKVVQWQARGAVHVHALLRTTASAPSIRRAVSDTTTQGWGWGGNVDLQPLAVAGQETSPEAASAILRRISYICRYATQDTTALLKTPLDSPLEAHLWKLREQARDLALERGQKRVERVADGFGYGGDILTHSRAWGSSFSRLRDERAQFVGIERELDRLEWRFAEVGWTTGGKAEAVTRPDADVKPRSWQSVTRMPPLIQHLPFDPQDIRLLRSSGAF